MGRQEQFFFLTLPLSAHHEEEQNKAEKRGHGVNWLKKGLWYGPEKLDSRLSENVRDIRRSHEIHHSSH